MSDSIQTAYHRLQFARHRDAERNRTGEPGRLAKAEEPHHGRAEAQPRRSLYCLLFRPRSSVVEFSAPISKSAWRIDYTVNFDAKWYDHVKFIGKWMLDRKMIDREPDYATFVNPEALAKVAPDRVTVKRQESSRKEYAVALVLRREPRARSSVSIASARRPSRATSSAVFSAVPLFPADITETERYRSLPDG
jgi:hypothetical protein